MARKVTYESAEEIMIVQGGTTIMFQPNVNDAGTVWQHYFKSRNSIMFAKVDGTWIECTIKCEIVTK